jgi:hypothetical protein
MEIRGDQGLTARKAHSLMWFVAPFCLALQLNAANVVTDFLAPLPSPHQHTVFSPECSTLLQPFAAPCTLAPASRRVQSRTDAGLKSSSWLSPSA